MAESSHDLAAQTDEIEALQAIYGDAVVAAPAASESFSNVHCVTVRITSESSPFHGTLQVTLPPDYPSKACPVFEVNSPCLSDDEVHQLTASLVDMFCPGEVVVFQCVELLREHLEEKLLHHQGSSGEEEKERECLADCKEAAHIVGPTNSSEDQLGATEQSTCEVDQDPLCAAGKDEPSILHGNPLTDRKSTFQAHVAQVYSKEEVKEVLFKLKLNRKIAMATHNIMAYRIFDENRKVLIHDCDNDGEMTAGSQLLRMLELMDVRNAVVVVSRWYGGVHLGPDRFKHINNCARTVIQDTHTGLTHQLGTDGTSGKQKQRRKKH